MILGMDVLTQMDIKIQIAAGRAQPNQSPTLVASARVGRNLKVPAGKSRIFFLENHVQGLTMFEPSNGLPEGLRGLPTLGKGNQMALQLDNPTNKDILSRTQMEYWAAVLCTVGCQSPVGRRKAISGHSGRPQFCPAMTASRSPSPVRWCVFSERGPYKKYSIDRTRDSH